MASTYNKGNKSLSLEVNKLAVTFVNISHVMHKEDHNNSEILYKSKTIALFKNTNQTLKKTLRFIIIVELTKTTISYFMGIAANLLTHVTERVLVIRNIICIHIALPTEAELKHVYKDYIIKQKGYGKIYRSYCLLTFIFFNWWKVDLTDVRNV